MGRRSVKKAPQSSKGTDNKVKIKPSSFVQLGINIDANVLMAYDILLMCLYFFLLELGNRWILNLSCQVL